MDPERKRIAAACITAAMLSFSVVIFNGSLWKAVVVFAAAAVICSMTSMQRWFQPIAIVAFTLAMAVWLEFIPPAAEWRNMLLAFKS